MFHALMHLSCDIYFDWVDGRSLEPDGGSFEQVMMICAQSYADAARLAEEHIARNWNRAVVTEMNLQAVMAAAENEEAVRSGKRPGVYHASEPKQLRVRRG